ncbi:DUF2339 domain-containing protein [Altererythrobacter aurantiacus]|uniref:DUF2339 domain-containing protein n=1 Tax=Parapontixanthobacter aurantiacus TaxID=1463599 RepID=A0A844ZGK6_9SPHN|nr:DUF2339 domain-containing protein [Parapontixanthobacter aurantiacus]
MTEFVVFCLIVAVIVLYAELEKAKRQLSAHEERLDANASALSELWRRSAEAESFSAQEDRPIAAVPGSEPQDEVPPEEPVAEDFPEETLPAGEPVIAAPPPESADRVGRSDLPTPIYVDARRTEAETDALSGEATGPSWRNFSFDFEDLFGRRLSIWAGGVTLAIAGILLVLFSIEQGLLSPGVRVALSFLFGAALLAAAELAHRFEARLADPRVRQALAGAGIATLYAAFYLAGTTYALIGAGIAFAGLAAVTAGAIALSYRYGLPCAVLGLVGGFAAPALVESDSPNIPLLTVYLTLVVAGLAYTSRRQHRPWLGLAALGGGFVWAFFLLAAGIEETSSFAAVGFYLIGLGALLPLLLASMSAKVWQRIVAAALASFQMAALIVQGGFDTLTWSLYLLLAAAIAFLGWRDRKLREASGVVAMIAVALLLFWTDPSGATFVLIAAIVAAITVGVPLAAIWLDRQVSVDLWQVAAIPLGIAVAAFDQFGWSPDDNTRFYLTAGIATLAVPPALAAFRLWAAEPARTLDRPLVERFHAPVASASLLVIGAGMIALPGWSWPFVAAPVAMVVIALERRRSAASLVPLSIAAVALSVFLLFTDNTAFQEMDRLGGYEPADPDLAAWLAALRWLATLAPLAFLIHVTAGGATRTVRTTGRAAQIVAAGIAYGALAQVVPFDALFWVLAALAATVLYFQPRLVPASLAALGIAVLAAIDPAGHWIGKGMRALMGLEWLLEAPESWRAAVLRILPVAALSGFLVWRPTALDRFSRHGLAILSGIAGTIVAHTLYKHLFVIETASRFVTLGLPERMVWEAALAVGGFALMQRNRASLRNAGAALLAAATLHYLYFTILLHNPLWDAQAVGSIPVVNLLLPMYAIGLVLAWRAVRSFPEFGSGVRRVADTARMALIVLLGLSLLRQIFAGSLLTSAPMGGTEDLLRSLLGIVLAIAFLLWGARTGTRSWRIGSLVVMLASVAKVFLVDAAGLEGLLRIASFMALGFSLIGIGWLYSRQLKSQLPPPEEQDATPQAA